MWDCTESPLFQIFVTLDRKFLFQPLGISFQKAKPTLKPEFEEQGIFLAPSTPFSSFHIQGKGKVGNIPYIIREVVSPFQANKKLKFTKKTHIGSWEEKISIHARHDSSCPAGSSTQTSVCKHAHVGKEAPWCSADNIQQHKLSLSQMVI